MDEALAAAVGRDFEDAYMLYVDNRMVGAYADREALEGLIGDIEDDILESGNDAYSDVRIDNHIRIEEQPCLRTSLMSLEEIDGLINPIVEYDAEMTYEVAAFSAAARLPLPSMMTRILIMLRVSPRFRLLRRRTTRSAIRRLSLT